jgi:putative N-acetylmannosamine-6-phosphate epimerase
MKSVDVTEVKDNLAELQEVTAEDCQLRSIVECCQRPRNSDSLGASSVILGSYLTRLRLVTANFLLWSMS